MFENVVLHQFITEHRDELIMRCRGKVTTRSIPSPIKAAIEHGVPTFLDELVEELRSLGQSPPAQIGATAAKHGHDLLRQGFTVSQVVLDYGDVCQAITEMAVELNAPISTDDFRILNRCLDNAIAGAVTQFGKETSRSDDHKIAREGKRLMALARELRVSIFTATGTLEALTSGRVGISGDTGAVLKDSLLSAHDLVDQLLVEVNVVLGISEAA